MSQEETKTTWSALNDAIVDHCAEARLAGVPLHMWLANVLYDCFNIWEKVGNTIEEIEDEDYEAMEEQMQDEDEDEDEDEAPHSEPPPTIPDVQRLHDPFEGDLWDDDYEDDDGDD